MVAKMKITRNKTYKRCIHLSVNACGGYVRIISFINTTTENAINTNIEKMSNQTEGTLLEKSAEKIVNAVPSNASTSPANHKSVNIRGTHTLWN